MKDENIGCLGCLVLIIIVVLLMSWQAMYAISQNAPQCSFARDVITCIEIVRANK
jgi:cobalamin synthase